MPDEVERLTVAVGADTALLASSFSGVGGMVGRLGKTVSGIGSKITGALGSTGTIVAAGLVVGTIAIAKFAMDAQKDIGAGTRTIRTQTGATGDALKGLAGNMKNVGKGVPESFTEVGGAIAQLNVKLGLSGTPLEKMTTQMLNLSRVGKVDIKEMTDVAAGAFNAWNISTKDQGGSLDYLFKVTQKTGIDIKTLTDTTRSAAPIAQQLGLSFKETAALTGMLSKNGLDATKTFAGFKVAVTNMAKAGKDPRTEFPKVMAAIKGARTETEAITIAAATFGGRVGGTLVGPIRSGKMDFQQFAKAVGLSKDSINKCAGDTLTFGQRMKILGNNVKPILAPIGKGIFIALNYAAKGMIAAVRWIGELIHKIQTSGGVFKTIRDTIKSVFTAIGNAIHTAVKFIISIWTPLAAWFRRNWDAIKTIFTVAWKIIFTYMKVAWKVWTTWFKIEWEIIKVIFRVAVFAIRNIIIPVFKAIIVAVKVIWAVLKPFFQVLWAVLKVQVRIAVWAIRNIILPIFRFIVAAVKVIWNVLKPFFQVLWAIIKAQIQVAVWFIRNIVLPVFRFIVAAAKVIWNALSAFFRVMVSIWRGIWNAIVAVLKLAWDIIVHVFNTIWNPFKAIVLAIFDTVKAIWSGVWNAVKNAAEVVWGAIKTAWHTVIDPLVSIVQTVWDAISGVWSGIWGGITGVVSGVWNALTSVYNSVLKPIVDAVGKVWDAVGGIWSSVWGGITSTIKGIVNAFVRGINVILGGIRGVAGIIGMHGPSDIPTWDTGGLIPGSGRVLINAQPGEYMQQESAVKKYGRSFMDAVNAGAYNPNPALAGAGAGGVSNTYNLYDPVFPGIKQASEADKMIDRYCTKAGRSASHLKRVTPS